ncbi:MAG: AMP-binding protein [Actinomycetota bacterium]|nr:AMP-binding protein [Actinomycetota bacterium]
MYPGLYAGTTPEKPAIIFAGSGTHVSYAELDARSNRLAHLLRSRGLRAGDAIAFVIENQPRFHEAVWAAQRSGLFYTPISTRLTAEEVAYIVDDCKAAAFLTTATQARSTDAIAAGAASVRLLFASGGPVPGFESYEEAVADQPAQRLPDEVEGADVLYSSGTTGKPKGVKLPVHGRPIGSPDGVTILMGSMYNFNADSVYLSPAPLYHAAPLRFSVAVQRLGGTVVVMEHFDPVEFLAAVERYRVTHTQLVPTMFSRLLKLPAEVRDHYDLSSLRCAIHAAAPCPVPVKRDMIAWWGPIIHEYYAGTEGNGFCAITSEEWLAHPGSVGRPLLGHMHIVGDDGRQVPTGADGLVYFGGGTDFEYLNDPAKTRAAHSAEGWSTLGDIGHVDRDGYLYLTDRSAYTIISGGVNIYPQETENLLMTHPAVFDVAVFGIPDPEMGQQVKAVVQPVDMARAGPQLEAELLSFCRDNLAHHKCPRSVDFEPQLPREPTGKLLKRLVRDRYWQGHATHLL